MFNFFKQKGFTDTPKPLTVAYKQQVVLSKSGVTRDREHVSHAIHGQVVEQLVL